MKKPRTRAAKIILAMILAAAMLASILPISAMAANAAQEVVEEPTVDVTPAQDDPSPEPSESVEPAESAAPSESAEPSESVEPAESAAPGESAEPSESAAPGESAEPSESAAPVESAEPSESAASSESTQPSAAPSAQPTESTQPSAEPDMAANALSVAAAASAECPFIGQIMPATFYVAKLNVTDINTIDPRPNGNYVRVGGVKGAAIQVPQGVEANAAGTGWGLLCDAKTVVAAGMVTEDQVKAALTKLYGTPDYGNKTIYWNVIKYHTGDYGQVGWHIDGYVIDGSEEELNKVHDVYYDYGTVSQAEIIKGVPFSNPNPVTEGESVPQPQITANGYTFVGWAYEGTLLTGELAMPKHDITLEAQWKRNVTLTPHTASYTYDGTEKTVEGYDVSGLLAGDSIAAGVTASASGTNAGDYAVKFNVAATDVKVMRGGADVTGEYSVAFGSGNLSIGKRDLKIVCDSLTVPYDGQYHTIGTESAQSENPVGFVPDGLLSNHNVGGFYIFRSEKNVGDYKVAPIMKGEFRVWEKVTARDVTQNYNISAENGLLKIEPATMDLTLTPHTNTVPYNGSEQSVSGYEVKGLPAGFTLSGVTAGAAGTDADEYPVQFAGEPALQDASGNDVTKNYILNITYEKGALKIEKAAITVTANDAKRLYGQDNPPFDYQVDGLKGTDTKGNIDLTVALDCTADRNSLPKDYPITASGPQEIKNYTVSYKPGKLTVLENDTLALNVTPYIDQYDAASHDAVSATATIEGAEITYSTDGENYSAAVPQIRNVASYPIYVKAAKQGYQEANETVTASITQAPLQVIVGDASRSYGEDNPSPLSTYRLEGLKGMDTEQNIGLTVTLACTADRNSLPNDYPITASGNEIQNYLVSYVPGKLTVEMSKALTVTPTPLDGTYNGTEQNGIERVMVSVEGATITYSTDGEHYSETIPQLRDAVENYPIYVKATKPGYQEANETVYANIAKAPLSVTADSVSRIYGEDNQPFTYTVAGLLGTDEQKTTTGLPGTGLEDTIGLKVDFACDADRDSLPDDYPITPSGNEIKNYLVSYYPGTLTVVADGTLAVNATPYNGQYDGTAHDGVTAADATIEGAKLTYSTDGIHYTEEMPRFQDAGSYPVYVKAALPGYEDAVREVTVNITKAALLVSANSVQRPYGQANPAFGYTLSGLVGQDTLLSLGIAPELKSDATVQSPAGETFAIELSNVPAELKNYTVTAKNGELTITKAPVTVTAQDKAKTVGAADPQLTAVVEGLLNGDALNYTLTRQPGEDAGAYAINVTPGDNPNYDVTTKDAVLTISAALSPTTPPTDPATPVTPVGPTTPTTPAGPTTPAAPGAGGTTTTTPGTGGTTAGTGGTTAGTGGTTTINDNRVPLAGGTENNAANATAIDDNRVPLAGGNGQAAWALLNLLLAIATGVIMIVLLIGYFVGKKKKEDEEQRKEDASMTRSARVEEEEEQGKLKRRGVARVLSIIPTVVAIIAFLLTENMHNPMVWTDRWTLLMAIIAIVQVVVACFTFKKREKKEEEASDMQAQNV